MKFLCLFLFLAGFSPAHSKDDYFFKKATTLYSEGKYQATVDELSRLEKLSVYNLKNQGFIAYWKGMAFNRLQDFRSAIDEFKKSLSFKYRPEDLHYEYGQALFASEKMTEARLQFSESFKRSFKRAASLYYMAFISKELGEASNARTLFTSILKLKEADIIEVKQAAQLQIADLDLEEAEKKPDVFRHVEKDVIPSYEKAFDLNPDSPLALKIKDKITQLQKKYELVLFQLRNGRPTVIPPYFLRLAQEFGQDSNVTFAPDETTIAKSRQSSVFSKTEFLGRYTFYYKNFLSFSPELRANNTYHFNRVPEIYRNDNYLLAPALRSAYEHHAWGNPASFLLDYEYSEAQRDVNAKERLEFSSRSHAVMIGEKFKYWSMGETVLRVKHRVFESFLSQSDSKTSSLIMEQVLGFHGSTVLLYGSLDHTKVKNTDFDTNALMLRVDWLLPKFRDWFTPSVGMGLTLTDPVNNRKERGLEKLYNPNLKASRNLGKNWKLNSRIEYHRNDSKDKKNFDYKKNLYGLELEYIF